MKGKVTSQYHTLSAVLHHIFLTHVMALTVFILDKDQEAKDQVVEAEPTGVRKRVKSPPLVHQRTCGRENRIARRKREIVAQNKVNAQAEAKAAALEAKGGSKGPDTSEGEGETAQDCRGAETDMDLADHKVRVVFIQLVYCCYIIIVIFASMSLKCS